MAIGIDVRQAERMAELVLEGGLEVRELVDANVGDTATPPPKLKPPLNGRPSTSGKLSLGFTTTTTKTYGQSNLSHLAAASSFSVMRGTPIWGAALSSASEVVDGWNQRVIHQCERVEVVGASPVPFFAPGDVVGQTLCLLGRRRRLPFRHEEDGLDLDEGDGTPLRGTAAVGFFGWSIGLLRGRERFRLRAYFSGRLRLDDVQF